jgi:hypothetical protein
MSANAPLWRVRRSPRVAGRADAVNGASPHSRERIRRWLVRPAAPASASPRRRRARAAGRTDEFNRARYPQPRINLSTRHCALVPAPQLHRYWASADLSEELPKNGDVPKSPLPPFSSPDAIGGHNSNSKAWLVLRVPKAPAYRHVCDLGCART